MRTVWASLVVLAALGSAAGLVRAENRGIFHNVGDSETTAIQPSGDRDTFVFSAPAGSFLSVTVKAAKGVSLLPTLELLRPDGTPVPGSVLAAAKYATGKSAVKFANVALDETGRWALRVSNLGPNQSGEYTLGSKLKFPKPQKLKGITLPEGGVLDLEFPMQPECLLSAAFKRKAGGTDWDGTKIKLFQPSGTLVPLPTTLWAVSSKGFSAKNVDIATPFGDYRLQLPGPSTGGDTVGDLTLKVKWPKRKGVARTRSAAEPIITGVTPSTGNSGTSVQVNGMNFESGATVEFGTSTLSSLVRNSQGTQFTGIVPNGSGLVSVTVINPDGQENTLADAFTYLPPPTVSSIVPNHGPSTGGTACTVTGTNFRAGMQVFFGSFPVLGTVTVVNSTTLTFNTESQASGLYTVEVRDPSGARATLAGGFTFDRVLRVTPNAFPGSVGNSVRVTTGILGDLDKDGFATDDLVVAHDQLQSDGAGGYLAATHVFRGNNNRTFTDLTTLSFPSKFFPDIPATLGSGISRTDHGLAQAMALGDLDGDGDDDLVLGVNGSFSTTSGILYFNCPVDGYAIPSYDPDNPVGYYYVRYPGTRIFKNGGNGSFTATSVQYSAAAGFSMAMPVLAQGVAAGEFFQARTLALGDVDGDKDLDLVLVTTGAFDVAQFYIAYSGTTPIGCGVNNFVSSAFRILANDGTGNFRFASGLNLVGGTTIESMQGIAMALGDLDGDKDLDAVVANSPSQAFTDAGLNNTRVALNAGAGTFAKAPAALPYPTAIDDGRATTVVLGDLDGDGDLDLVLSTPAFLEIDDGEGGFTRKSSTRVLLNDGYAAFTDVTPASMPPVNLIERWDASHVALGDLDGDGDADMALTVDTYIYDYAYLNDFIPATRILLNNGKAKFTPASAGFVPPVDLGAPSYASPEFFQGNRVFLGDLDGDNDRDIVLGSRTPTLDFPATGSVSPSLRVIESK